MKTTTELVNELKVELKIIEKLSSREGIDLKTFQFLLSEESVIWDKIKKLVI